MSNLVLVIDTQADFILPDGALPVAGATDLVEPLRAWLADRTATDTAAMVFTFDTHFADTYPQSAEAALFPIHCVKGTPGWRNLFDPQAIDPAIPCRTLEKGVFDMWAEPDLTLRDPRGDAPVQARDAFFGELSDHGVRHAIVVGVAADYCVRWAVDGLVARGFSVEVPADLTRGIERQIDRVVAEDFAGQPVAIFRNATQSCFNAFSPTTW
ncbi:isochorismatase family protein [Sphingomonas sp. 2R-10]|uniref:cysteine hydrolase family protein n=1 Tax=Sphingomonas sp. 2R-10 TaxID=3045148 RepID=UPI000F788978|nr:isochorismatase family protein [Sphingomonas sp. 2R-10]MDJ0278475.1 isochorismatase family protein [Sphingomonas sp. 2R-10]